MQNNVMEVVKRVTQSVVDPKPKPVRLNNVHTTGQWVRQGDVYFILRDSNINTSELVEVTDFNGQLAEGSQRGSRHIVDPKLVKVYRPKNPDINQGYILVVNEGVDEVEVSHPDHGSVILGGECTFEVNYQVNFINKSRQRVQD